VSDGSDAGAAPPTLSVVIATKDRAPFVARCLEALAAQDAPVDEVIVVDQSADDGTLAACEEHGARHVRDPGRGQSRGRNIGLALASGDLIACLDDDCYAHPDWARAIRDVMARHPDAAGAFGEMLGGRGAPAGAAGLEVSTIAFPAEVVHRGRRPPYEVGYGGNFVLRREAWRTLGPAPCDELLDPGSPNPGAGDMDLIHRLLRDGAPLVSAPTIRALHDQHRPAGALVRQMRGYGRGTGAYLGKHIFSGDPYAVTLLVRQLGADVRLAASGLRRRSLLRLLAGASRTVGLAHGLSRGPALARRRRRRAQ
jgi:glycosyltransferase involved in cell wall biosynthesis